IDFRYIPEYRMGELIRQIENLISRLKTEDNAVTGEASIVRKHLRSHTGLESETEAVNLPFYTSPSEELVKTSSEVLRGITGKAELGTWTFGTDGAYFASLGIPTIGIGPGEERFAHTVQEHVRVSDLLDATKVYAGINLAFCG
ncbi:MAG: M20/M25/M40 family metallo-hydrolase, partial [Thaumarchaeota archaeon]